MTTTEQIKHVRCDRDQSVFDACKERFGVTFAVVTPGARHPEVAGMVGTITVRPGESYAVVPR